jgi:hypothetical protein
VITKLANPAKGRGAVVNKAKNRPSIAEKSKPNLAAKPFVGAGKLLIARLSLSCKRAAGTGNENNGANILLRVSIPFSISCAAEAQLLQNVR